MAARTRAMSSGGITDRLVPQGQFDLIAQGLE